MDSKKKLDVLVVFSEVDSTELNHVRRIFMHCRQFHYSLVVRLGILREHRLWKFDANSKLVLGTGSLQYISSIHIRRNWWQTGATNRPGWAVGRIVRSRSWLVHGTIDPSLFVQHLWPRAFFDTADSHVLYCLDGAVQFLHLALWKIQYRRVVFAVGLRLWHVGELEKWLNSKMISNWCSDIVA